MAGDGGGETPGKPGEGRVHPKELAVFGQAQVLDPEPERRREVGRAPRYEQCNR